MDLATWEALMHAHASGCYKGLSIVSNCGFQIESQSRPFPDRFVTTSGGLSSTVHSTSFTERGAAIMTLDPQPNYPNYPNARNYVVKLHRDAVSRKEKLRGRLEHIDSGRVCYFERAEELIAFLALELTATESAAQTACLV
jgi:hypothetical protein